MKKYKDIFLIEEINRLLFYKNRDYIIEIIAKPFFNSLYNLFNIELTILGIYFDDILKKD